MRVQKDTVPQKDGVAKLKLPWRDLQPLSSHQLGGSHLKPMTQLGMLELSLRPGWTPTVLTRQMTDVGHCQALKELKCQLRLLGRARASL